jgi:hypothetical protein
MSLPKSELLRFFTTVRTTNNKSYSVYTLSDYGASYRVMDSYYTKSLGIVLQYGSSIVMTTQD